VELAVRDHAQSAVAQTPELDALTAVIVDEDAQRPRQTSAGVCGRGVGEHAGLGRPLLVALDRVAGAGEDPGLARPAR
jgi:hypothetical protein